MVTKQEECQKGLNGSGEIEDWKLKNPAKETNLHLLIFKLSSAQVAVFSRWSFKFKAKSSGSWKRSE